MSLRKRILDLLGGTTATQETLHPAGTFSSWGRVTPLSSAYENMFAQLRPLIDEMKIVFPFGIDAKGEQLSLNQTPALAALANPNENMGWGEFADAMFATWLSEPALFVHVWRRSGGGVYGYTILPHSTRVLEADGTPVWKLYDTRERRLVVLRRDEVATLRFSRSPKDLTRGVSPATVAFVWAQIDDLVAQYQRAFFENGAVPATITFITAGTRDSFEAKRRALENGLKGARNRNKTIYAWRQMLDDNTIGEELDVKAIQGNNSTLAIKDLVSIINDRMNKTVGVSNFILGDDSSAKYDNAELSDHQFTKRRVYPALVSFWGQFQHELDRITGGLGYGISFELEIPELTDRLKTKAETEQIQLNTKAVSLSALVSAIHEGARPLSAVEALGLGEEWQRLAEDLRLKYLSSSSSTQDTAAEPEQPEFNTDGERQIYKALVELAGLILAGKKDYDLSHYKDILTAASNSSALAGATAELLALKPQLEEAIINGIDTTHAAATIQSILEARASLLVNHFDEHVSSILQTVMASDFPSKAALKKALREAVPLERAETIARTESHYAQTAGNYAVDRAVINRVGGSLQIKKTWLTRNPDACDLCKALNGTSFVVSDTASSSFPQTVWSPDHKTELPFVHSEWNDEGRTPHAHPNCTCGWTVEIVRGGE